MLTVLTEVKLQRLRYFLRDYCVDDTPQVIEKLNYKFPRLVKILADGGYKGDLADWVKDKLGWILEVVLRPDECPSKFQVLPKRWIVERSFSWQTVSDEIGIFLIDSDVSFQFWNVLVIILLFL